MRISTNQLFDLSVKGVLDNQSKLSHVQQQLSSGKKLLRPSDDPVGASQVIRLTEELNQIAQYQANNNLLKNSLEQEEVVMENMKNALNRARQLAVEAGNGIFAEVDKAAIGIEIEQIRGEAFDLMNSRNAEGEYIFAGYQSHSPAFEFNPSSPGNKYNFVGDDGQNEIQISPTVRVKNGDSGKYVFEDVPARLKTSITGSSVPATLKISQQDSHDFFHENNYDRLTPANNNYQIQVIAPGDQATVTQVNTGTVVGTYSYNADQPFVFKGMEFNFQGGAGDTVDFTLQTPEKKNIAETLNDFAIALNDENISDADFAEALADALVGIDNASKRLADANSAVGGRLNVAESVFASNLDLEITNKLARSSIDEVDYAEAVTELSKQENALQAAQSTFSRVTQLSLFDYL
ncbi:flagellar hook-associated protein FlgL [Neptunicella marina]|uniref:Flagellar hook-associated protein FlgL n=1 Tax=Neptunicella marina TaxID=2125989 RepID=A0A8J6IWR9_9ALTE|nr:flagellar hook-associated protein FlgL [Neptunicella marina]MBC3766783.1 flagellar hook-associated protein FlgL [Neptunicella marina]